SVIFSGSICFGKGNWTISPSIFGSWLISFIFAISSSSVTSTWYRIFVDSKPTNSQLRILLATYVSLPPSFPTKIATKCGLRPDFAVNADASFLISSFIFADTSFPSNKFIYIRIICFLIQFQNGHECGLWNFHVPYLTHSLLTFLLFFQQFTFSGDIASVTFCGYVFT